MLALCVSLLLAAPAGPEITTAPDGSAVTLSGLSAAHADALRAGKAEACAKALAVYVDRGGKEDTPLLGTHKLDGTTLRFEPRFPLLKGVRYKIIFDPSGLPGGGTRVTAVVEMAKPKPAAPTAVAAVYPTRDDLPENQLKFYLHFSAPMSRGEAYQRIALLDEKGKPVTGAFLELGEELWDREGRRFTLFFDPGRIKRGLKPREEFGPALEEGKKYTLVIDKGWPDADGEPLKETHKKSFRVLAPDDAQPDPKKWAVTAPKAGTKEPLTVTFPESLDHALLQHTLTVVGPGGKPVAGAAAVGDKETRWQWTPAEAWPAGAYDLVIDTKLEDLAGNSPAKPFEVDVFRTIDREVKPQLQKLAFTVAK